MRKTSLGIDRRSLFRNAAALTVFAVFPAGCVASESEPTQSPIRIKLGDVVRTHLPALHFNYPRDVSVTMKYIREDATEANGCSVRGEEETVRAEVEPGAASLAVGGVTFHLAQMHWHTPSEHLRSGKAFPIEQHFVHQNAAGETLVLGVWVRYGPAHATLGRLYEHLVEECAPFEHLRAVDLASLLPASLTSFRYDGSLTTAPYSEGVTWVVLAEPIAASPAQIGKFQTMFPDGNRRDIQALNGRVVLTDQ